MSEGAAAGTPDRLAGANAVYSDGSCNWSPLWALDHYKFDVIPFDYAERRFAPDDAADLYHYGFLSLLGYHEARFPTETWLARQLADNQRVWWERAPGEKNADPMVTLPTEFGWPPSGSTAEAVFDTLYESASLEWALHEEWRGR